VVRLRPADGWDADGLNLLDLVARVRGVPSLLLLHPSRCSAPVAEARQLAMYLMHVIQRRSYAEIAALFGRDRTTVSYACAHVEDRRDRPRFEAEVAALERVLGRQAVAASHGNAIHVG
jgi:chromosomal replication initiation ATPase DnaA